MSLPTYESGNVKVSWYTEDLSAGWAEDTFLTIEPITERKSYKAGADGAFAFSKSANKGAVITMTFQQTAPINKRLALIAAMEDVVGGDTIFDEFRVTDLTGDSVNFLALGATLTEVAGTSFGATSGEKTWVWVCESYLLSDNPVDIASNLKSYLPF